MLLEYKFKLAIIVVLIVIDTIWLAFSPLELNPMTAWLPILVTVAAFGVGMTYHVIGRDTKIETMCIETAFLVSFSLAAATLSYLLITLNFPLIDDLLVRWDAAFGFDWVEYVAFVNERPWLGTLFSVVYATSLIQVAMAVVILSLVGRINRVREMMWALMISGLGCIIFAGFFPSAGALGHFQPAADFYLQNRPMVDLEYKQSFFDLRNGLETVMHADDIKGLVAFPSYHVSMSVLIVAAFRSTRYLFWPMLVLNTIIVAATPIDGGHHMVDAIGGFILAAASVYAAIWLRRRFGFDRQDIVKNTIATSPKPALGGMEPAE
jgi:membrane-associated phospholipid phosphatase